MSEKKQFDEFLGGTECLPHEVHIMKFVSSRAAEIAAMTHSIDTPEHSKLIFQKLPLHMRRRVMSHNAKRMPRRLREAHSRQMAKSGLPPKNKRPSRKYRRRPFNLLTEYNRRQRNKVWLETHIWHAKRFHMTEKWGYRIASHSNDKCFKANYRAIKKHCLLQDISYYTCIEISGPENLLKETLKAHCNLSELTFAARIYLTGNREGMLMFYKKNGYPNFPIGHVYFLWRPNLTEMRTIWIWVHPACYHDIFEEIILSFNFVPLEKEVCSTVMEKENIVYINKKNCQMRSLKGLLNRFRFYGPLTLAVLTNALQVLKIDSINTELNRQSQESVKDLEMETESSDNLNIENDSKTFEFWHIDYYNKKENLDILFQQNQLWKQLSTLLSPNQLPPNIVIPFTVLDPRFYLPEKRTKCKQAAIESQIVSMPSTNSNQSPIWEENIRKIATKLKPSTAEIQKLRSECLVPGVKNDEYFSTNVMAKIPILLIQKPGISSTGTTSRIDIILPANWAMPFWLAFILRGCRVGAIRESSSIAFESLNFRCPDVHEPDTNAYKIESINEKLRLTKKYLQFPPNKRVNFTKLGISSPFYCHWEILVKEWSNETNFSILRDRHILSKLQTHLSFSTLNTKKSFIQDLNVLEFVRRSSNLIRVKVTNFNGQPKDFSLICMPTSGDLKRFKGNKNWSGPVEQLRKDPNKEQRVLLRKNHLIILKRLRKQNKRNRLKLTNKITNFLNKSFNSSVKETERTKNVVEKSLRKKLNEDIIRDQAKKMSELYLPECSTVRHSCDREVMGYVVKGGFALSEGIGVGIGYVTVRSLLEMTSNLVLTRNTRTRQYRFAKLEIMNTY
ncbi:ribonucleases P/MRP protein subunit POP1 [Prorops nasuta]|uniref:ribonucleases P/MRP protein subunit POP1 n=1 Tax=Prorops nasuta TaxID=863751 RepID=UPI0034CF2E51